MPDIAKCKGEGCPLKEKCWRFISPDSEFRQSYFTESPIKDGKCDMFWDNTQDSIIGQLKKIKDNENDKI